MLMVARSEGMRSRLRQWLHDAPTRTLNTLVQRLARVNGDVPWPVHYTSRVTEPRNIRIGRDVERSFALSGGCYIQGINGIRIGDGTLFGPGVKIISANHARELATHVQSEPIEIGKRCWIGANSVILPGVRLGDDVTVGAGAVVTKSFASGSVIAGNPARVIGPR